MRSRRHTVALIALAWRPMLAKLGVMLLFAASFSLILMHKTHPNTAASVRAVVSEVLVPLASVVAAPLDALHNAQTALAEWGSVYQENSRLRAENTQLLKWQAVAQELRSQNETMAGLLKVVPDQKQTFISGRIVADTRGPYVRSALISAGAEDGVKVDQAVIAAEGVVGRVVEANPSYARVLLLTDINSRIPVISEHSRERAIAQGNNTDLLSLAYRPDHSNLQVGEKLLTSGDGGVMPAGLPVGVVTAIGPEGAQVTPLVDWSRLELVSIVDFSL